MAVDRFVVGSRRTALGPAELIRSVRIPEARPSAYLWQRVRPFHDISHMAIAVSFSPNAHRWRIAIAGFPPRSLLVPSAEEALGTTTGPAAEAVARAAQAIRDTAPIAADLRASEEYRRRLVLPLLARAVAGCSGVGR